MLPSMKRSSLLIMSYCYRSIVTKYQAHASLHLDVPMFQCPLCPKSALFALEVINHMRSKHKDRPNLKLINNKAKLQDQVCSDNSS